MGIVNRKRLIDTFCELSSIDAISFEEREKADYLKKELLKLDFQVMEDTAGECYHSETGNLYAYKRGTGPEVLLSAHMDTVEPGRSIKVVIHENGRITSDGTTVLGADDNAGLTSIVEALRLIKEQNLPSRSVELLFTIGEEAYIRGSEVFDYRKIKAKEAYVLDLSGPIGTAAVKAPTLLFFEGKILGRAAHAGFAPKRGINAIQIAGNIIANLKQGRIDEDTTVNIGCIKGGAGTNIVSPDCTFSGEVRSLDHERALQMVDHIEAITRQRTMDAKASYEWKTSTGCIAYETNPGSVTVRNLQKACEKLHIPCDLITTFGGSDNNNLMRHGIQGVVLACGMEKVHTCQEYTTVDSLEKSTELILELLHA
ncbi:MAG: M20/M25/M40 family metallo-hydrolase [Lachnospiraceae bacterium]|nr:M20/M25/M40 family metallo-hydrolase [Lachnospiraceae bacterium]